MPLLPASFRPQPPSPLKPPIATPGCPAPTEPPTHLVRPKGTVLRVHSPPKPAASQLCCRRGSPSTSYLPEPAGTTFLEHPTSSHPPSTPGGCKPAGPRASCRSWDGGSRPPSCGGSTGESRAAPQQRRLWGELGRALLRACVCVWLQDLILFRTPDRHRWAAGTKA